MNDRLPDAPAESGASEKLKAAINSAAHIKDLERVLPEDCGFTHLSRDNLTHIIQTLDGYAGANHHDVCLIEADERSLNRATQKTLIYALSIYLQLKANAVGELGSAENDYPEFEATCLDDTCAFVNELREFLELIRPLVKESFKAYCRS